MDTENLQYDAMFEARLPVEPEIHEALVRKCQENPWLKDFGAVFREDPFLDMDSPFSFVRFDDIRMLELFFLYGNWSFRTGVIYHGLAFINQVNGGDEWWTLRYEAATDTWQTLGSISFRHIAIHSDFKQYISSLERTYAVNTETKQELVKLATLILEELNYIPSAIQEFKHTMTPMYSEEPRGMLFNLNPEELQRVRELEEKHECLCYAVIKGRYKDSFGDVSPVNYTYLTLDEDDLERYRRNVQQGELPLYDILDKYSGQYQDLGYRTWAYVSAGDITEHGTVAVRSRLGGLTRTC